MQVVRLSYPSTLFLYHYTIKLLKVEKNFMKIHHPFSSPLLSLFRNRASGSTTNFRFSRTKLCGSRGSTPGESIRIRIPLFSGSAGAFICDFKAATEFLRHSGESGSVSSGTARCDCTCRKQVCSYGMAKTLSAFFANLVPPWWSHALPHLTAPVAFPVGNQLVIGVLWVRYGFFCFS